jgi:hypothetical protein
MVIEVKPVQNANAWLPMCVTLFGMVIEVKFDDLNNDELIPTVFSLKLTAAILVPLVSTAQLSAYTMADVELLYIPENLNAAHPISVTLFGMAMDVNM